MRKLDYAEHEPEIRPYKLTELEQAIRQRIAENLDDVNKLPWLVGTGAEAASTKIDSVVELLNSKAKGDDEVLVKTMRVARNAVLHVCEDVQQREFAVMFQCPCIRAEWQHRKQQHHQWPHYTAGCFSQESDRHNRIGGRLWDVVEFLRLHSGYESPKLVAQAVILALQQIAGELRSKEEGLTRLVEKIRKSVAEAARFEAMSPGEKRAWWHSLSPGQKRYADGSLAKEHEGDGKCGADCFACSDVFAKLTLDERLSLFDEKLGLLAEAT
jgi:hypothetical protein